METNNSNNSPFLDDNSHNSSNFDFVPPNDQVEENIAILYDMGFKLSMINKVYLLLKPNSIEEAIRYLTEDNGIYQHHFYESRSGNQDLCFICKKGRRFHIGYVDPVRDDIFDIFDDLGLRNLLDRSRQRNNLNNNQRTVEEPEPKEEVKDGCCVICFGDINKEELERTKQKCNHQCCVDCWYEYIKTKITEAKVGKITCVALNCKTEISEDFIMNIINNDSKLISKYERFKKRALIINNPKQKFCPEPDCDSYLEKGKNKYVQCKNGHKYCYNCLKKWHGDVDCDKELDKDFQLWKANKVIKQCPNCNFYTEKNEGCNHMTCAECKYQWCWLCLGKYEPGHFTRGTCNGLQFSKLNYLPDNVKNNNDRRRYDIRRPEPRRCACCPNSSCRRCWIGMWCGRCRGCYNCMEDFCLDYGDSISDYFRVIPMYWFFGMLYLSYRIFKGIPPMIDNIVLFLLTSTMSAIIGCSLFMIYQFLFTGLFSLMAVFCLIFPMVAQRYGDDMDSCLTDIELTGIC